MEKRTRSYRATFERLTSRITDDCIIWPGKPAIRDGYGRIQIDGVLYRAHRLALIRFTGVEHADLDAAHGPCHNRMCINARGGHVEWKTRSDNLGDRERDGTAQRGETCGSSKLSSDQVLKIRRHVADGVSQRKVGDWYGVSQATVSDIVNGRTWSWLGSAS